MSSVLKHGMNQNSVKNTNCCLVLRILNSLGRISRTEIAKRTGLTKTSITNITTDLIEQGIINEVTQENENVSRGRTPIMLEFSKSSPCALGVSINRDFVYVSLVALNGKIIDEDMLVMHDINNQEQFLHELFLTCEKMLKSPYIENRKMVGIGIASIGPLDIKQGIIVDPPNFNTMKGIRIKEAIEKRFGHYVVLQNDMNACAIAEKLFGHGKRVRNFVYLGVTNGIGSGVVINKQLVEGENCMAGEVGHVSINMFGERCACGNNGCLELYASIPKLEKRIHELLKDESSLLSTIENVRWHDIIDAAYKNDKLAHKLLDEAVMYLVAGVVNIVNVYDPQVIYIGHELAVAGKLITEKLNDKINEKIFSKHINKVQIEISCFKDMMYRINGAAIVLNEYFEGSIS